MQSGTTLLPVTQGRENEQGRTKRRFLAKWIEAINTHSGFGRWTSDVSHSPVHIHPISTIFSPGLLLWIASVIVRQSLNPLTVVSSSVFVTVSLLGPLRYRRRKM